MNWKSFLLVIASSSAVSGNERGRFKQQRVPDLDNHDKEVADFLDLPPPPTRVEIVSTVPEANSAVIRSSVATQASLFSSIGAYALRPSPLPHLVLSPTLFTSNQPPAPGLFLTLGYTGFEYDGLVNLIIPLNASFNAAVGPSHSNSLYFPPTDLFLTYHNSSLLYDPP
ncbi:unnamed protein product, partial [Dibothriocephalus latus]